LKRRERRIMKLKGSKKSRKKKNKATKNKSKAKIVPLKRSSKVRKVKSGSKTKKGRIIVYPNTSYRGDEMINADILRMNTNRTANELSILIK
jgi:hypothetical protein